MTMQNALLTIPTCNCYKENNQGVHCAHPENTHTPPTGGIGISCKTQNFKEMCEALFIFIGISRVVGGGGLEKIPSVGEVWIFSGTTHKCFQPDCIWFSMAGKTI